MLMKGDANGNDSDVSSLKTYDEAKGLLVTKFHEFVIHEVNDYYIHNYQYKHLLAQKKTSINVEAALRGDYSVGSDAIKELKGHIVNDYRALMSLLNGGGSPSKMKTMCMLQEKYGMSVKQLVTIVACENGETQVVVLPPKKEYFLTLMSYISEYQERHGQETIIRG